jgi:hypothetical protein
MRVVYAFLFSSAFLVSASVEAEVLALAEVTASSTQDEEAGQKFSTRYLGDNKQGSAWIEGEDGSGLGSWVELKLAEEARVTELRIWNGNWYTSDYWERFNRINELEVQFSDGSKQVFNLSDKQEVEIIRLDGPVVTSSVKLKAKSIYRGNTFNATGFSEIQVIDGNPDPFLQAQKMSSSSFHPESGDGNYLPGNVGDGIVDTMWCENDAGDGSGQWIEWALGSTTDVSAITLFNGNAFSFTEFMNFNRAKTATLSFSDGSTESLVLKPSPMAQEFSFSTRSTRKVRLSIGEVTVGKNEYNILCISEARLKP